MASSNSLASSRWVLAKLRVTGAPLDSSKFPQTVGSQADTCLVTRYAFREEFGVEQVFRIVTGPVDGDPGQSGLLTALFLDHAELAVSGDDKGPVAGGESLGQDESRLALPLVGQSAEFEIQRYSARPGRPRVADGYVTPVLGAGSRSSASN